MHDEIPPLNALRERAFRFRKEGGYAAHPIEAALSRLPGLVEAGAVESLVSSLLSSRIYFQVIFWRRGFLSIQKEQPFHCRL